VKSLHVFGSNLSSTKEFSAGIAVADRVFSMKKGFVVTVTSPACEAEAIKAGIKVNGVNRTMCDESCTR
jgi:GMP synthase-like glutamine amidotransferase